MTSPTPAAQRVAEPQTSATARLAGPARWLKAVIESTRPRQWPKNLLVFAAPLAGHTFGKSGFWYGVVAFAAFVAASSAVYLVNDTVDAERDRHHPYKKFRPIASGRLPKSHALVIAAACVLASIGSGFLIGLPLLAGTVAGYLLISFLYSSGLKHVPVAELACVASGFLLRVVGGAAATRVPPSGWFLTVCSLGALMVAIAKRYTELTVLGSDAAKHRPAMAGYTGPALRIAQRAVSAAMVISYLFWAAGEPSFSRPWHLVSTIALAAALVRFDRLTARATSKPVEDLIARDPVMVCCELAWLALFALGL